MHQKISVPAFIFKPVNGDKVSTETIKRKDDILEIEFPVFEENTVLEAAKLLSLKKRKAHDRSIDETLEIMEQVAELWLNPNFGPRKEALDIIPMMTGQSRRLCEIELNGLFQSWNPKLIETNLRAELGGKEFLESWIPKGDIKVHAQPRGVVFHNLAGNAFSVGVGSLFYGLITKNVNLVKLPHEEPYFTVKLAESMREVDKRIANELAVLYWSGRKGNIYDSLFNSGYIDCVIAWGGLQSIETIRKKANRYGIKIIDHGPKMSFGIISEDALSDINTMKNLSQRIANDVAVWNQRACVSPRVMYIKEKPRKSAFENIGSHTNGLKDDFIIKDTKKVDPFDKLFEKLNDATENPDEIMNVMQRSAKMLKNQITDLSPLGFAKCLAEAMERTDQYLPIANLTEAAGMDTTKKQEYFSMKYELTKNGTLIKSPKHPLNWTVVYLRNPPNMMEIDMCMNRFVIVTRISNTSDLIHFMKKEQLSRYLQTISVYGSDEFIEEIAEEFSLLGASRFPRIGEHNAVKTGAPWDGHYILNDMVRWVSIDFLNK